jgi:hypothetical protein
MSFFIINDKHYYNRSAKKYQENIKAVLMNLQCFSINQPGEISQVLLSVDVMKIFVSAVIFFRDGLEARASRRTKARNGSDTMRYPV